MDSKIEDLKVSEENYKKEEDEILSNKENVRENETETKNTTKEGCGDETMKKANELEKKDPVKDETENEDTAKAEAKSESVSEDSDNEDAREEKAETKEKDGWEDVLGSGSLLKKTLVKGHESTRPERLNICIINYKGTLEDGTLIEKAENVSIQLGDLEVIQGVDLALALMDAGEKCLLKIAPRLAYGSTGLDTRVPPDTTVIYEVELLHADFEDLMENLTITQRKEKGDNKRKRGNWWYGRGECTFAIQCYRRALDYLDEVEGGISEPLPDNDDPKKRELTDAMLQELLEDRVNVSNNMAAAQMKLGAHDAALQSLQVVLRCQPNNVKALYRKSRILRAKNDINESLACLQRALKLEPENATIQKQIQEIKQIQQKNKNYEKELARRMFNGSTKPSETTVQRPKKSSKTYVWASVVLSVAVGIAGIAAWRFKFS